MTRSSVVPSRHTKRAMPLETPTDTPLALPAPTDLERSIRSLARARMRGERALGVILWLGLGLVLVWQG